MTERELILNAISRKNTPKKKKTDVFDTIGADKPNPLDKLVKRQQRKEQFKKRNITEWTTVDFVNYLDVILKEFGIIRVKRNTRLDSNQINKLYDEIANLLKIDMTNDILKEYIEWWCSIYAAQMSGQDFYLQNLSKEYQIKRFVSRYGQNGQTKEQNQLINIPVASTVVNDDILYDVGGLNLLIMKRGIVVGYKIIRKNTNNPLSALRDSLVNFDSKTLINVMNITIQNSPYSSSDFVDFMTIAEPFLQKYKINDFKLDSSQFFKS